MDSFSLENNMNIRRAKLVYDHIQRQSPELKISKPGAKGLALPEV